MKYLFLFGFSFSFFISNAQGFEWAAQIGGAGIEQPHDILVDKTDGSIYISGFFYDHFDPDPDGSSGTTSIDGADAMLVKLDTYGDLIWANHIGGLDSEFGTKMAFDDQQNVVLVVNASPKLNIYKFSGTDGSALWYYSSDYSSQVNGYGITLDDQNNVYVTGAYSDTVDFDNSANTQYLISEGNEDGFVLKLDDDGNYVWAKTFGNTFGGALFRDIEYHQNHDLFISGFFHGQVDFDPSTSTNYLNAFGSTDAFALRLDSAGNFVWVKQMGSVLSVQCNGLAIDPDGDIVMTGYYDGTINLDPNGSTATFTSEGNGDIYVHKLDTNGNIVWAKSIGGTSYDAGQGITIDDEGNVYLTGPFGGQVDFDPSSATFMLDAGLSNDSFILKLDNTGDFSWAAAVAGKNGFNEGHDVDLDANQHVIFTGNFGDTTDLDPTTGTQIEFASDPMDWFVIKLNQDFFFDIPSVDNSVIVYPNPAQNFIRLKGVAQVEGVVITDVRGQVVHQSINADMINIQHLAKGHYFLTYLVNETRHTATFVKE